MLPYEHIVLPALVIGVLSGGASIFLNYCLGKPSSDKFSPHEIFSDYTVWLSIKRLQKIGLYNTYIKQYNESLNRTNEKHEVISLKNDFKKMLYDAAEPFFTWERAVGMCLVCTGFLVSLFTSLIFTFNISEIIGITVISHLTIRILNKVL